MFFFVVWSCVYAFYERIWLMRIRGVSWYTRTYFNGKTYLSTLELDSQKPSKLALEQNLMYFRVEVGQWNSETISHEKNSPCLWAFPCTRGLITDDLLTTKFSTVAKIVSTDGYVLATRPHFARGCPRVWQVVLSGIWRFEGKGLWLIARLLAW